MKTHPEAITDKSPVPNDWAMDAARAQALRWLTTRKATQQEIELAAAELRNHVNSNPALVAENKRLKAFAYALQERDGILYPVNAADLVELHRAALAKEDV